MWEGDIFTACKCILLLSQVVYYFTCLQYITYIAITCFNSYCVKRSILSVHIVIIIIP